MATEQCLVLRKAEPRSSLAALHLEAVVTPLHATLLGSRLWEMPTAALPANPAAILRSATSCQTQVCMKMMAMRRSLRTSQRLRRSSAWSRIGLTKPFSRSQPMMTRHRAKKSRCLPEKRRRSQVDLTKHFSWVLLRAIVRRVFIEQPPISFGGRAPSDGSGSAMSPLESRQSLHRPMLRPIAMDPRYLCQQILQATEPRRTTLSFPTHQSRRSPTAKLFCRAPCLRPLRALSNLVTGRTVSISPRSRQQYLAATHAENLRLVLATTGQARRAKSRPSMPLLRGRNGSGRDLPSLAAL